MTMWKSDDGVPLHPNVYSLCEFWWSKVGGRGDEGPSEWRAYLGSRVDLVNRLGLALVQRIEDGERVKAGGYGDVAWWRKAGVINR